MKKVLISLFATVSVFAAASAASATDEKAGSSTANLTVQATLKEGCSINFGGGDTVIDFGTLSAINSDLKRSGTFSISCSALSGQTTGYKALPVKLSVGNGRGSTEAARALDNGDTKSETLGFQVYQGDGTNGIIWGDKDAGTFLSYKVDVSSSNATKTGGSNDYTYTVVLQAKKDLSKNTAGTYKSTMVATVDYTKAS